MDFVDNYPKMSHLLKKLAFTKVYMKLMSSSKVEVENDRFIVQFQSLVKNI